MPKYVQYRFWERNHQTFHDKEIADKNLFPIEEHPSEISVLFYWKFTTSWLLWIKYCMSISKSEMKFETSHGLSASTMPLDNKLYQLRMALRF